MSVCKIVDLAYALVPLLAWRRFLIRRHMETCLRCQAFIASRAEARGLFATADSQRDGEHLWLRVRRQLNQPEAAKPLRASAPHVTWKWALGLAALLAAVTVNLWILRGVRSPETEDSAVSRPERFDLKYVRIEDENANAFVYQPQNSDLILVWVGKDRIGGDL
jgi:hypothetical protein